MTLLNPVDEDNEQLGVSSMSGLNVNITLLSPHTVLFSGVATTADYTEAVKRLTYEHRDAAPGNPSTGETRYDNMLRTPSQNNRTKGRRGNLPPPY